MEQKNLLVSKWGNSAGVLVPKSWLGQEVKVSLVDRTLQIKKEVFEILKDYFQDIIGVYLVGSYARGEQGKNSDIDIIAVSKDLKKEIISGKYHVSIYPVESIEKTLKKNPMMIYPRLVEAKPLFNSSFLEGLDLKYDVKNFSEFIRSTKRIAKINREILELDKLDGEFLESVDVIYSLILRLRGIFILDCLSKGGKYSRDSFEKWIVKEIPNIEFENIYGAYENIKNDEKVSGKFNIEIAERLLGLLEREVAKHDE